MVLVRNEAFATKIPADLKRKLDEVCRKHGLRKNIVVEQALREKFEDLLDAFALEDARKTSTSFVSLKELKRDLKGRGKSRHAADLGAFKKRAKEPSRSFESVLKDMKRDGLL